MMKITMDYWIALGQLAGESDKSSIEGGVQGGVMHAVVDQDVVETALNLPIPKNVW